MRSSGYPLRTIICLPSKCCHVGNRNYTLLLVLLLLSYNFSVIFLMTTVFIFSCIMHRQFAESICLIYMYFCVHVWRSVSRQWLSSFQINWTSSWNTEVMYWATATNSSYVWLGPSSAEPASSSWMSLVPTSIQCESRHHWLLCPSTMYFCHSK